MEQLRLLTENTSQRFSKIEESLFVTESEMKKVISLSTLRDKSALVPMNQFIHRLASLSNMNTKSLQTKRDTVLLDARLNIHEILNDKNKLLLTEENLLENSCNSSGDEEELNVLNTRQSMDRGINLSFSLDEQIEVSLMENSTYRNELKLSTGFDTFDKKTKISSTVTKNMKSLIQKTNRLGTYSPLTNKGVNLETSPNSHLNVQNKGSKAKTAVCNASKKVPTKTKTLMKNAVTVVINTKSILSKGNFRQTLSPFVKKPNNTSNQSKKNVILNPMTPLTHRPSVSFNAVKKKDPMSFLNKSTTISKTANTSPIITKKKLTSSMTKSNNPSMNNLVANSSKKDVLNMSTSSKSKVRNIKGSMNSSTAGNNTWRMNSSLTTEFNVIEEYDYSKILNELRAIFGEDLEYFDENMLFSNLDELSNKGLIKGLIKLCHMQDKRIKLTDNNTAKIKATCRSEIANKEKIIRGLNEELNRLRNSLKGLIHEPNELRNEMRRSLK